MPLQIGAVLAEAHLSGSVPTLVVAGRTSDVVDARRPRGIVALVVLRAERLEPKLANREPSRRDETGGHECVVC